MSEFDSLDDCNEALYELALEQNIECFKSMLSKVKSTVESIGEKESLEVFLDKIQSTIFGRNK